MREGKVATSVSTSRQSAARLSRASLSVSRRHLPALTAPTAPPCLPHRNVAAPQAETGVWLGTDATGCGRGACACCVVLLFCSQQVASPAHLCGRAMLAAGNQAAVTSRGTWRCAGMLCHDWREGTASKLGRLEGTEGCQALALPPALDWLS